METKQDIFAIAGITTFSVGDVVLAEGVYALATEEEEMKVEDYRRLARVLLGSYDYLNKLTEEHFMKNEKFCRKGRVYVFDDTNMFFFAGNEENTETVKYVHMRQMEGVAVE